MKFYLIELSNGDAKIEGKAIYEYDNLNDALANFHTKLGVAMKSELYESEQILVINSENGVHASDKFTREIPHVEIPPIDITTNDIPTNDIQPVENVSDEVGTTEEAVEDAEIVTE